MVDGGRKAKGRTGRFGRHHALVHNGWLAVLTAAEMKLWNAYEEHAKPDGISYPSSKTLAELLGHQNSNHIGKLRDRLAAYGLLEVTIGGGGRGNLCTVRMLTPPQAPKTPAKHSRRGSVSANGKHSQNAHLNTPDLSAQTLPNRIERNKEEQLRNSIEQSLPQAAPRAADTASSDAKEIEVPQPANRGKFPPGVWRRACDGWTRAYEHVHRVRPTITPRDAQHLSAMLVALDSDLDALAAVIRAGLRQPNVGYWQGHKLRVIAENLDFLRGQVATGQVGLPQSRASPKSAEREAQRERLLNAVFPDVKD